MRVLIVGAGGHAQVIADAILCSGQGGAKLRPIGYVDDNPKLIGTTQLGLPVLGNITQLASFPHDAVIVGIGNNQLRRQLFLYLQAQGETLISVVHPSAVLANDVVIGKGCVILANAVVGCSSRIGANTIINTAATVDHHNNIADHAHIAPGAHLGGDVTIGEGTLVGIGAIVIPQRSVGFACTIGAGAVVHQQIPDRATAVGVPARVIKFGDENSHRPEKLFIEVM